VQDETDTAPGEDEVLGPARSFPVPLRTTVVILVLAVVVGGLISRVGGWSGTTAGIGHAIPRPSISSPAPSISLPAPSAGSPVPSTVGAGGAGKVTHLLVPGLSTAEGSSSDEMFLEIDAVDVSSHDLRISYPLIVMGPDELRLPVSLAGVYSAKVGERLQDGGSSAGDPPRLTVIRAHETVEIYIRFEINCVADAPYENWPDGQPTIHVPVTGLGEAIFDTQVGPASFAQSLRETCGASS
jgi:hypothetical protein